MKAEKAPVGGRRIGLERALRVIADRQRDVRVTKSVQHLGDEPTLVPELDRVQSVRQRGQPAVQAVVVTVEVLRELPQNRSQPVGVEQRLQRFVEALDAIGEVRSTDGHA